MVNRAQNRHSTRSNHSKQQINTCIAKTMILILALWRCIIASVASSELMLLMPVTVVVSVHKNMRLRCLVFNQIMSFRTLLSSDGYHDKLSARLLSLIRGKKLKCGPEAPSSLGELGAELDPGITLFFPLLL